MAIRRATGPLWRSDERPFPSEEDLQCPPPRLPSPCTTAPWKCCAAPAIPSATIFARNPDDEVCARYHVADLFAKERQQLLGVVDLYRYDPTTHSEVVPVLGNKGAGKTHLLHSIKHGLESDWQLPGHAGDVPERRRFPGIPSLSGDRHAPERRHSAWHAAADVHRRRPDATLAARGADGTAAGPASGAIPGCRPGQVGAQAGSGQLASAGTDAMADRQPGAAAHARRHFLDASADLRGMPSGMCHGTRADLPMERPR